MGMAGVNENIIPRYAEPFSNTLTNPVYFRILNEYYITGNYSYLDIPVPKD